MNSNKKQNYCGNSSQYDLNEIKNFDLYKDTKSIKLVSFKPWVKLINSERPMKEGRVNVAEFLETVTPSITDQERLFNVLVNYDFSQRSPDSVKSTVLFCYEPRNAILFYNESDSIIGYVELCFECFGYKNEPTSMKLGEFCDEKYNVIKGIFKNNGIKYGLSNSKDEDQLEYLEMEVKEYPDNPILLTSSADLKMKQGQFEKATALLDMSIKLDSTSWRSHFLRAQCKLRMKDFDDAIKDFDYSLSLNNRITQAYHERAQARIGVYELTNDKELVKEICSDLKMFLQLGGADVDSLSKKYCREKEK